MSFIENVKPYAWTKLFKAAIPKNDRRGQQLMTLAPPLRSFLPPGSALPLYFIPYDIYYLYTLHQGSPKAQRGGLRPGEQGPRGTCT